MTRRFNDEEWEDVEEVSTGMGIGCVGVVSGHGSFSRRGLSPRLNRNYLSR